MLNKLLARKHKQYEPLCKTVFNRKPNKDGVTLSSDHTVSISLVP